MRYRMEAIERTVALSERLQRRDYSFGPYYPFKVYEPKERLVLAIDFEGKVVQHSLCDNVLEPAFSRRFIRDNYAGQIGKGTHDGLDRLAAAMRHYVFIGWAFLKLGTAYRLAAGSDFAHKFIGLGQTVGAAFADFAPSLALFDWLVGIVGAVAFRLLIYFKSKNAKKYRRDAEYGSARWSA